jgi:hypothetical protein
MNLKHLINTCAPRKKPVNVKSSRFKYRARRGSRSADDKLGPTELLCLNHARKKYAGALAGGI